MDTTNPQNNKNTPNKGNKKTIIRSPPSPAEDLNRLSKKTCNPKSDDDSESSDLTDDDDDE